MKRKIILILLMLGFALSAKAQLYFGGNLGLSVSSGNEKRIGVVIAPEVGYRVNPHLTVGGTLSYRSLQNSFGITPYLRGDLVNIQDFFYLFLSLQTPLHFSSGYQSYAAYIRPGLSFRIAEKVLMTAHVGAFGYSFTVYQGTGSGGWSARVNTETVSIGFCFSL